jgi:hypothetical protein
MDIEGALALYWDPFSHMGIYNYYGLSFDQYFGNRFGLELSGGLGFHGNISSDNYVISDDFQVKKKQLKWNGYLAPYIALGMFLDSKNKPRRLLSKGSIYFLQSYNVAVIPVLNYQLTYFF